MKDRKNVGQGHFFGVAVSTLHIPMKASLIGHSTLLKRKRHEDKEEHMLLGRVKKGSCECVGI